MKSVNPYMASSVDCRWEEPQIESWADRSISWLLFSFSGRLPRGAFWIASLFIGLIQYGTAYFAPRLANEQPVAMLGLMLVVLPFLVWSSLAVQTKRWHDRGKSGFWCLLMLVPIIGPLWVFIETGFLPGDMGENRYGA